MEEKIFVALAWLKAVAKIVLILAPAAENAVSQWDATKAEVRLISDTSKKD